MSVGSRFVFGWSVMAVWRSSSPTLKSAMRRTVQSCYFALAVKGRESCDSANGLHSV